MFTGRSGYLIHECLKAYRFQGVPTQGSYILLAGVRVVSDDGADRSSNTKITPRSSYILPMAIFAACVRQGWTAPKMRG